MTSVQPDADRLAAEGVQALRSGDMATARDRLAAAAPALNSAPAWYNLALARRATDQAEQALADVSEALTLQPRFWAALLLKGRLLEQVGRVHEAAGAYDGALACAPPFGQVPIEQRADLRHAFEYAKRWHEQRDAFLRERLDQAVGGKIGRRLAISLDVLSGKRPVYRQQPQGYLVPELPCIEFYDTDDFPWLQPVLAETDAMREEFLTATVSDAGLEPYIQYGAGAPVDHWAELNHNPRWSALHLLKDGAAVEPHAAWCPRTLQALAGAPQPEFPGRSPVAMFSLLKPRTRIPPHTGTTNARLIVHVPLVVPPACGIRVGAEKRSWTVGEALVFDDTIEHEAWNDSDSARCVLIFDIWNPHLRDEEREAVTALYAAMDAFGQTRELGWSDPAAAPA